MATAKELRPVLQAALRAGSLERGWTAPKRGAGVFSYPVVGTELVVEWDTEVEGYRYGGMQFGGLGHVTSPEVAAELMSYPVEVWTERRRPAVVAERPIGLWFTGATAGDFLDPRGNYRVWEAQTSDEVTESVIEFFAMVDGPVARWIRSVTPVGTLLDSVLWSGWVRVGESTAELFALLALRHDRPKIAQTLLQLSRRRSKEPEVLDAFEHELAVRHSEVLLRHSARVSEHPLWRSVADALWTGFHDHGWAPSASLSGTFEIPSGPEGLVVQWTPAVEIEGSGGLRFGGFGLLTCPGATQALLRLPAVCRPWAFDGIDDDEAREAAWLEVVTAGRLVDPDGDEPLWTMRSLDEAADATVEFFTMVDGPLARWIASTATLDAQLRLASSAPQQLRRSRVCYQPLVLLGLEHGRTEAARAIIRTGMRYLRGADRTLRPVRQRDRHPIPELRTRLGPQRTRRHVADRHEPARDQRGDRSRS